jgi:hypothetical protein
VYWIHHRQANTNLSINNAHLASFWLCPVVFVGLIVGDSSVLEKDNIINVATESCSGFSQNVNPTPIISSRTDIAGAYALGQAGRFFASSSWQLSPFFNASTAAISSLPSLSFSSVWRAMLFSLVHFGLTPVYQYVILSSSWLQVQSIYGLKQVLDIIARDSHYKYLVVLIIPTTSYFVIANWVGWQYYRNS